MANSRDFLDHLRELMRAGGRTVSVRAMFGGLAERFKDPWLGFAIGGAVVGLGVIGNLPGGILYLFGPRRHGDVESV